MLTMDKYIKKEEAIRALLNDAPEQVGYSREDAADCIRYMDAADVAPVRHGRWVNERSRIKMYYAEYCYDCSECGQSTGYDRYPRSSFCPCCGARMDEEG